MSINEKDQRRFLAKVGLPDEQGCMPWLASVDAYGYGQIALCANGRQRNGKAHRIMHELFIGPIPAGLDVDHRCGNRICVAPDHLRAATRKQNMENLGGARRDSKTGVRGVSLHRGTGKWAVKVGHHRRSIHIGLFDSIEEADRAAHAARAQLFTSDDRDRTAS